VHCCLSQAYAHTLCLREEEDEPKFQKIAPQTFERLEDDILLPELVGNGDAVARLAKRFMVCVRRNPDTTGKE
jgi:hypothetical protein